MNVATTTTIPADPQFIAALALIGQTVGSIDDNDRHTVHSVEGPTWYAFAQDGRITFDVNMTPAWSDRIRVMIIPEGSKIGEGFGREVPLAYITAAPPAEWANGQPVEGEIFENAQV